MITVRIDMVSDVNDTYRWLFTVVQWAVDNCPTFVCVVPYFELNTHAVKPYIKLDPDDPHFEFEFGNQEEATLFLLRWS